MAVPGVDKEGYAGRPSNGSVHANGGTPDKVAAPRPRSLPPPPLYYGPPSVFYPGMDNPAFAYHHQPFHVSAATLRHPSAF